MHESLVKRKDVNSFWSTIYVQQMKKALTIHTNTFMTVLFCCMFLILVYNVQNRAEIIYKQYLKTCRFFFYASSLVASDVITINCLKWRIINTSKFLSLWLLVVQLNNYLLRNFHSDRVFTEFFGTACLNFRVAVPLGLLIMIRDYIFHSL